MTSNASISGATIGAIRTTVDVFGLTEKIDDDARRASVRTTFGYILTNSPTKRGLSDAAGISVGNAQRLITTAKVFARLGQDDAALDAILAAPKVIGRIPAATLAHVRTPDALTKAIKAQRADERASRAARVHESKATDTPTEPTREEVPVVGASAVLALPDEMAAVARSLGMLAGRVKTEDAFDAKAHKAIVAAFNAYTKAVENVGATAAA